MVNESIRVDEHVGELLSGMVDGELTQQERQRVTLHCEQCEACRNDLAELRALRERLGNSSLSEAGEDTWRETMNEPVVANTRGLGWLLFLAGILAVAGVGMGAFIVDPSIPVGMKLILAAIYGGLALLLISVLRQRLIERKTDKYKDVEI
jgi:ferric-dicitrate binding protein FerR (iron transport regulator)